MPGKIAKELRFTWSDWVDTRIYHDLTDFLEAHATLNSQTHAVATKP